MKPAAGHKPGSSEDKKPAAGFKPGSSEDKKPAAGFKPGSSEDKKPAAGLVFISDESLWVGLRKILDQDLLFSCVKIGTLIDHPLYCHSPLLQRL